MIKITSINHYCSQEKLKKLAIKSGFLVGGGKRHLKVRRNKDEKPITGIPRHTTIKKFTAEEIIKILIKNGAKIEIQK